VARLRSLLAGAWAPVLGMTLLFALQEVHVIVVKHEASNAAASSWAVAAVAAKGIIWVAVGLGMYLLPEVARRAATGEDARPILARTLALIAVVAVPMVVVYAVAAKPLLSAVFGPDLTDASGALPLLGVAMAMLALAYLAVQYMLALGRSNFIWVLGAGAVAEVLLLLAVGANLTTIALVLSALQLTCAVVLLALSFRRRSRVVPGRRAEAL
jgi:O-antigen/teichoic acid export membrane protein